MPVDYQEDSKRPLYSVTVGCTQKYASMHSDQWLQAVKSQGDCTGDRKSFTVSSEIHKMGPYQILCWCQSHTCTVQVYATFTTCRHTV